MRQEYFGKVGKRYASYEKSYRALVAGSNEALGNAKRAIFAFHRNEVKDGEANLATAAKMLNGFESEFKKEPMLRYEGAYRAAVEEFVEACLYSQFLSRKPLGNVTEVGEIDPELYLGGLSDLTGELVRYAVARATEGDAKEVKRARETVSEVMSFLISLDLTGYLRQKYDQAKNSLRRMEEIAYDISIKRS